MKKLHIWFIVSFLVLAFGLAQASTPAAWRMHESTSQQQTQSYVLTNPVAAGSSLTITAQLRLEGFDEWTLDDDASASKEIWLAGVSGAADAKPTLLALVWQLDDTSWFPVWRLYVRSDAGLLPSGETLLQLASSVMPVEGGVYQTIFSYDPGQGVLSIRVTEESKTEVLYASNLQVGKYTGALYPGAGIQGVTGKKLLKLQIQELAVKPYFVPAGARMQLLTRKNNTEPYIAMRAFDRRDEWQLALSLPNKPLENDLRVVRDDGKAKTPYLTISKTSGDQQLPFDGTSIPAGKSDLVLVYEVNGEQWEIDRVPLHVGVVKARLEALELLAGGDGEPGLLGLVRVSGDGALPPFNIKVGYDLSVAGSAAPLHERWQNNTGTLTLPVEGVSATDMELPVRVPLGSLAGLIEGKELFTKVTVSADVDVPFIDGSVDRTILGERVPVFPKVGEYTVLRGDFHSHSTQSDGDLSPEDRLWESYMYGYDTLALTDHRKIDGYLDSTDYAEEIGLSLVRGFETGIDGKQHLVVLGTDDAYQMRDEHSWARQPNATKVFYQDQVREVIAHGGYIIYAHPGGEWVPPGPYKHPDGVYGLTDEIQWMLDQGYIHGVESRGSYETARRDAPYRWAIEHDLALFDVSDVHGARNFTRAYQAPVTLVLAKENTPEGVLEALWNNRTLIWRNGVLRGMNAWLVPFIESMLEFQVIERNGEPCLQITNKGALGLYGTVQVDGDNGRFSVLSPMGSIYLPSGKDVGSVTVSWGNVFDGPGHALVTKHSLK